MRCIGLVRWANWTATDKTSAFVTMRHALHPQPGYPLALELTITYSLSSEGLDVLTSARNVGSDPAPYACGQHPYLAVPRQVDECHLHLPRREGAADGRDRAGRGDARAPLRLPLRTREPLLPAPEQPPGREPPHVEEVA
jgi:galactose mutarotase-like enzyme